MTEASETRSTRALRSWPLLVLAAGLVVLGCSFADYFVYSFGPAIAKICAAEGSTCAGRIATRNAWHGILSGSAVVLAGVAGLGAALLLVARPHPAVRWAVLGLDLAATLALVITLVDVPQLVASTGDLSRTIGDVPYDQLVTTQLGWAFWTSLAASVAATACAAGYVAAYRRQRMALSP